MEASYGCKMVNSQSRRKVTNMNDNEILEQIKTLAGQLAKRTSHILQAVEDIQSGWLDKGDEMEYQKDLANGL